MTPVYADELLKRHDLGRPRPKGTLPRLPGGRDLELLQAWVTRAFRPADGYTADTFDRAGRQRTDPCSLTFRNGRDTVTYRWSTQADLRGAQLRANVLAVTDGWCDMGHLTASEVDDVWAALVKLGKVASEVDERDEARKWVEQLLDTASPLRGQTLEPEGRHDALMAIRHNGEFRQTDALALVRGSEDWVRRPVRFVDEKTDEQWIRAGETAVFVRWVVGADRVTHAALRARLSEIGVEAVRFEARQPPHPKAMLYRLTEELVEFAEDTQPPVPAPAQEPLGGVNERGERMPI